MTDAQTAPEKKKRFRSPSYPMFDLGKAVDRASALLNRAHHHPVGAPVLSEAWGMKSVGGKVWRTAAALIQYGLIIDSGTGKSRKFQIADIARRIIKDSDPTSQKRKEALKTASLSPMINKELWETFKTADGLSDAVLKTHLTVDRAEIGKPPYSSSAADEVIGIYRASLAYAGITDSDTLTEDDGATVDETDKLHNHFETLKAKVGDFVKWTSNGVDQFETRKVEWVSDDQVWLRVFGNPTGIPMEEVTITDPPTPPKPAVLPASPKSPDENSNDINVYLTGDRLQITADVDGKGLEKLKNILSKYDEILKMLQ